MSFFYMKLKKSFYCFFLRQTNRHTFVLLLLAAAPEGISCNYTLVKDNNVLKFDFVCLFDCLFHKYQIRVPVEFYCFAVHIADVPLISSSLISDIIKETSNFLENRKTEPRVKFFPHQYCYSYGDFEEPVKCFQDILF